MWREGSRASGLRSGNGAGCSRMGNISRTLVPLSGALSISIFAFVALHHAIDHRQSQAGPAALRLGGEERFQTAQADCFIHAQSVVAHFHLQFPHRVRAGFGRRPGGGAGGEDDVAAGGEGVHGVEDDVGQGFAKFGGVAEKKAGVRTPIGIRRGWSGPRAGPDPASADASVRRLPERPR